MSDFFVILHVLAAVLLMGPVTVATSLFAPQFRKAATGDVAAKGGLQLVTRITRAYGFISILVPVLGLISLFTVDGALERYNFHAAALLAVIAWVILVAVIIPQQRRASLSIGAVDAGEAPASEKEQAAVQQLDPQKVASKAAMFGGIFNLLWIITAILMFF